MTYAVYNYAAGASQANVLSDLIKILTGETNKANLSAACVQANTSITATVAAGWAVYDASAGSNYQVIRALNQDASTYKYFRLGLTSTTALSGTLSESWNSSTHVGTNNTAEYSSVWSSSGGGYFYIYVTSKNICIQPWTAGGYQVMTGMIVNEISRDAIPSTYPCGIICNAGGNWGGGGNKSASAPRTKKWSASGDNTPDASLGVTPLMGTALSSAPLNGVAGTFRDASENLYLGAYKLACGQSDAGNNSGPHLGVIYDVYACGANAGNALDEITYSGTTYVIFKPAGSAGQCSLLVPKA